VEDRDESQQPASVDVREIAPRLAYSIGEEDAPAGVSVLVLRGELDLAAASLLGRRVDEVAPGDTLVIDLAETTFIDSAVLRELLRARAEVAARDGRLVLAGITAPVRRLLDLTRTSELFEEAPDAPTAIRRLSG
jgi:anti-sigma B factor antagonist